MMHKLKEFHYVIPNLYVFLLFAEQRIYFEKFQKENFS